MTRLCGPCLVLLLTGLLCAPSGLRADMAPLVVSGGAASTRSSHKTIRMESEEVTMRLERDTYTVTAVFHFSNSGETVREWVGFPRGNESFGSIEGERPGFLQFHAWVNGQKVRFSEEGKRWLAARVTFPGHAKTIIRVVYEADYYGGSYAAYIVGTGSHWKDSIGRAGFTVEGSAIGGTEYFTADLHTPKGHKLLTDKAVRIEARDYDPEPKAELTVTLNRSGKAMSR